MAPTVSFFQTALRKVAALHTMQGLARRSDVPRANLVNYSLGRARPSVEALAALAKALPPQERGPLILAHLLDECPAAARADLILELRPYLLEDAGAPPDQDLDALFTALRHLAETRPEVREFLAASLEVMR